MIDIDSIKDERAKKATLDQINNFGQTPAQLLKKPHPKRNSRDTSVLPIFAMPKKLQVYVSEIFSDLVKAYFLSVTNSPLIFIGVPETNLPSYINLGATDKIITVDDQQVAGAHRWAPTTPNEKISPFTFELDPLMSSKRFSIYVTILTHLIEELELHFPLKSAHLLNALQ